MTSTTEPCLNLYETRSVRVKGSVSKKLRGSNRKLSQRRGSPHIRCSRNRSGKRILEQLRTTNFNNMSATHSIQYS
jgi:hypothetical protein